MSIKNERCLVLNASYEPISLIPLKRALTLLYEGKADIVEEHPTRFIHTAKDVWPFPTQIVLRKYVVARMPFRAKAKLTQRNLFIRDNYTCQYCGRHKNTLKTNEFLTRDHIFPRERGGRDTWLNVITACSSCNNKKSNYVLEELDMELLKEPTVPTVFEIMSKTNFKKRI